MVKKIVIIFFLLICLFYIYQQVQPAAEEFKEVSFTIKQGEGVKEISQNLKKKGLIKNSLFFSIASYLTGQWNNFQQGEYKLSPNMNFSLIIQTLLQGPKAKEETITILEGWTNVQIAEYLENKNICQKEDFLNSLEEIDQSNYSFLKDKPKEIGLQGYLFPDTYQVYAKSPAHLIIEKMLSNFQNKLDQEKIAAIEKQGKTIFETITLASLIEKEASDKEDKKIVSGIFQKRLEINMPLESCASINYILASPKPRLSKEDLEIDSPYNTYLYPGLPPSPINNPGLDSIEAAIWPEETDYLYFLAGPEGKNVYAKTFEEHQQNRLKYLK